jgi:hypothetical protein
MRDKFVGAGGTPGGVGEFVMGVTMCCGGLYLILNQVTVSSRFFLPWLGSNQNSFGAVFTVFLIGVTFVFFDAKSSLGWMMLLAGAGATVWGVISNLEIYFRGTTLINAIFMFGLVAGGFGLVLKGLAAHPTSDAANSSG